jgi:AraC-like DNA-binding protein/mannose-6-phosphate isomerase-like protein (cupin superfamily)
MVAANGIESLHKKHRGCFIKISNYTFVSYHSLDYIHYTLKKSPSTNVPIHRFNKDDIPFSVVELIETVPQSKTKKNTPHRHNFYEIFVFTKGGGKHMIDFKEYEIKANSLHFISPGMIHTIKRNSKCIGYVITFTDELYSIYQQQQLLFKINLYHNHQLPPIIEYKAKEFSFIHELINQLNVECNSSKFMRSELILSCLNTLLISANRKFTDQHQLQQPHLFVDERVQSFRKWLDQPINEKLLVSNLAKKLNVSVKKLSVMIKRHTGLSPMEHITNRLIIEAKRLLVNTEMSVKEVAFALFFEDPAYFGRFFRKHTSYTPQYFRNKMVKKYHT